MLFCKLISYVFSQCIYICTFNQIRYQQLNHAAGPTQPKRIIFVRALDVSIDVFEVCDSVDYWKVSFFEICRDLNHQTSDL
jgi:hypothetical protein